MKYAFPVRILDYDFPKNQFTLKITNPDSTHAGREFVVSAEELPGAYVGDATTYLCDELPWKEQSDGE